MTYTRWALDTTTARNVAVVSVSSKSIATVRDEDGTLRTVPCRELVEFAGTATRNAYSAHAARKVTR